MEWDIDARLPKYRHLKDRLKVYLDGEPIYTWVAFHVEDGRVLTVREFKNFYGEKVREHEQVHYGKVRTVVVVPEGGDWPSGPLWGDDAA